MIGAAYISVCPFHNKSTGKMEFKKRPVLVIGQADFALMKYPGVCYIRTHKQTIINSGQLVKQITDFKENYPDTYLDIIAKVEEFQKKLVKKAI